MIALANTKSAKAELLSIYDNEQLANIAKHGCVSGVASQHIYNSQCRAFFEMHGETIEEEFFCIYGEDWITEMDLKCSSIDELTVKLVWAYIEHIAFQVTEDIESA
jgi:hypothetical protein